MIFAFTVYNSIRMTERDARMVRRKFIVSAVSNKYTWNLPHILILKYPVTVLPADFAGHIIHSLDIRMHGIAFRDIGVVDVVVIVSIVAEIDVTAEWIMVGYLLDDCNLLDIEGVTDNVEYLR